MYKVFSKHACLISNDCIPSSRVMILTSISWYVFWQPDAWPRYFHMIDFPSSVISLDLLVFEVQWFTFTIWKPRRSTFVVEISVPLEFNHYGLAAPLYTHFTSPIRRYSGIKILLPFLVNLGGNLIWHRPSVDVVVHRLLAASLGINKLPDIFQDRPQLTSIADSKHHLLPSWKQLLLEYILIHLHPSCAYDNFDHVLV